MKLTKLINENAADVTYVSAQNILNELKRVSSEYKKLKEEYEDITTNLQSTELSKLLNAAKAAFPEFKCKLQKNVILVSLPSTRDLRELSYFRDSIKEKYTNDPSLNLNIVKRGRYENIMEFSIKFSKPYIASITSIKPFPKLTDTIISNLGLRR